MGTSLSSFARDRVLDELERREYDCLVIGGGITGAGIACEAARRGLSVALLEAHDYASGTSSRSSKLVQGGLRYLVRGEVAIVRVMLADRRQLARLAPHLAEPAWMVIPSSSPIGPPKVRLALSLYERIGGVDKADRHRMWTGDELMREEPWLNRQRFPNALVYREYLTDDARLVIANLRAAADADADVINHVAVEQVIASTGRASGVDAACRLSGRRIRVRAKALFNAAGPWVDAVRKLEAPHAQPMLQLSKGVHVVLPAARLPIRNVLVAYADDGRAVIAVRRGSVVYLGPTDTVYPRGAEVWPEIVREDARYLIDAVARYCAAEPPRLSECLAAWAGLRPLLAEPGKRTTELSRRDEVVVGAAGVITIAGGKLSGYRSMARQALERAEHLVGRRLPAPPDDERALPGGNFQCSLTELGEALARATGLSHGTAARLVRLYGDDAQRVVAHGAEPLVDAAPILRGEVDWAIGAEGAQTVEDVLFRRTRAALYDATCSERLLGAIADRMQVLLGWTGETRDEQVRAVVSRLHTDTAFMADAS
jgi:glycerol-3-phosphate dehydrogenase